MLPHEYATVGRKKLEEYKKYEKIKSYKDHAPQKEWYFLVSFIQETCSSSDAFHPSSLEDIQKLIDNMHLNKKNYKATDKNYPWENY